MSDESGLTELTENERVALVRIGRIARLGEPVSFNRIHSELEISEDELRLALLGLVQLGMLEDECE